MSAENLERLISAYCDSFKTTKLLARNPTMGNVTAYPVGFHDDNYIFNSSDYRSEEWDRRIASVSPSYVGLQQFYDFMIKTESYEKWKTEPYAAEISGVIYFKNDEGVSIFEPVYQGETFAAFMRCRELFHTSFIMGCGPDAPKKADENYDSLMEVARLMGYELGVTSAKISTFGDTLKVSVTLKNTGIAPFYYDWDAELAIRDESGTAISKTLNTSTKLSSCLPDESVEISFTVSLANLDRAESYQLEFSILNPLSDTAPNALNIDLANNNKLENRSTVIGKISLK